MRERIVMLIPAGTFLTINIVNLNIFVKNPISKYLFIGLEKTILRRIISNLFRVHLKCDKILHIIIKILLRARSFRRTLNFSFTHNRYTTYLSRFET